MRSDSKSRRFGAGFRLAFVPLAVLLALVAGACSSDDSADGGSDTDDTTPPETTIAPLPEDVALPIVFVHGFAGSAQQYESQAMRFVANGYDPERIVAFDHDGAGMDIEGYTEGVDETIDAVLAETGAEQVFLVGHSRGTFVSNDYLSDPGRAAKVAKYIAIDGRPCPDTVPCIAPTQDVLPGQAHVETATSPESFAMQYEFLIGEEPETVDLEPQEGSVEIQGRAVSFPANTGRAGATLDIWPVDPDTGQRSSDEPHATFEIGEDGEFGPVELESGAYYEYALSQPGTDVVHHLYLQPYVRDSRLVRLLSSEPDGSTRLNTNQGEDHSSIIAIRMREWYGSDDADLEGDQSDVLNISVDGGDPVDAVEGFDSNGSIGLHIHDDIATPGETTLGPLPYFSEQPFQQGIDVFMASSADGSGTISVTNLPRGDTDKPQVLNTPNWPSSTNAISVVFTDYPVA